MNKFTRVIGLLAALTLLISLCPLSAVAEDEVVVYDDDFSVLRTGEEGDCYYQTAFKNFAGLKKLQAYLDENGIECDDFWYTNDEEPLVIDEDFTMKSTFYATGLEIAAGATLTVKTAFNTMSLTVNGTLVLDRGGSSGWDGWDQILELHNNGRIEGSGTLTLQYASVGGEYFGEGTVADTVNITVYSYVTLGSVDELIAACESARNSPANFHFYLMSFFIPEEEWEDEELKNEYRDSLSRDVTVPANMDAGELPNIGFFNVPEGVTLTIEGDFAVTDFTVDGQLTVYGTLTVRGAMDGSGTVKADSVKGENRITCALETAPKVKKGDADGDGTITSTDARLTLQISVNKIRKEAVANPDALDVDGDGGVTSTDARLLLQVAVGKITEEDLPGNFTRPDRYERELNSKVYDRALGDYAKLINAAKAAKDPNERLLRFAKAEAALLDSAVMIPTTTQGGNYAISRVAPHTVPYVQWGSDDKRLKGMVISDEFLTKQERADLLEQWTKAVKGEGAYDPAAYLTGKGHVLDRNYRTTFSTFPYTLDWQSTSASADIEILVNCVDGLVEYDNLNRMQPALAESWDVSEDGLTYTFHIRKGVKWFTAEGVEYAELTAHDFEAGFRHMLDAQAGLEWLVEGVVKGVFAYFYEGDSWDCVGYKATDDYTLTVTLESPVPYFLTMITYSCFLPICDSFYRSKGGVYGVNEYAQRCAEESYAYGLTADASSQVYCGPFRIAKLAADSEIVLARNESYYKADQVNLDNIFWINAFSYDPADLYRETVEGAYPAIGLSLASGTLELAMKDGNFDKYAYVTDTTSTSYFGGLNLNRGTFELENGVAVSSQTEDQRIDTHLAIQNKNFRRAVQFAFDKAAQNAVTKGEDLKLATLRNMLTPPEFISLSAPATLDGKTWPAGTFYGEAVQFYLERLGSPVKVADGIDGWYNPEAARAAFALAKADLESKGVSFPIHLDVVYYAGSVANTESAEAYKKSVEAVLGAENVTVDLIGVDDAMDYYACGYRVGSGAECNFDMFYGSGWGPDYGDPSTYLNIFQGDGAGFMTKIIGLF